MPEQLEKLRPDRDLQCYFERPSAIAALSQTSASGLTLSGSWRQCFDWAVIEWNRDNVFEHPSLRNLPDGDLSGLVLTYEETRTNCIPVDSDLYPTVDWPFLRVWTDTGFHRVRLRPLGTPVEGAYAAAAATFELAGSPSSGDYIELAWSGEHHTYQLNGGDSLESAVQSVCNSINAFSSVFSATRDGRTITLQYLAGAGANGNRVGVYGNVSAGGTEAWSPEHQYLSGGTSPVKWRFTVDFSDLHDEFGNAVLAAAIRKLRWTYAAELPRGQFDRQEFQVAISNWNVNGASRGYLVAGPGSRRIEDDFPEVSYSGTWTESQGNYSGGSIRCTTQPGNGVTIRYTHARAHRLYLGTRRLANGASISAAGVTVDLTLPGEDVLARVPLGEFAGGVEHTILVSHAGAAGQPAYFDFLEIAEPSADLPQFGTEPKLTLATDWDTDHSLAIAPERTAWLVKTLGFRARANHYAGALWFYELIRQGHQYASGTVTFAGSPDFGGTTTVSVGIGGGATSYSHLNLIGDTASSIARALEQEINRGSTAIWAETQGSVLTIWSRAMGAEGNAITLGAYTGSTSFTATASGPSLQGGADGQWQTDAQAMPRVNRAARDWTRSYLSALHAYGIDAACAFSMELQHGDPAMGQFYPDGTAAWLNTPALQTNLGPQSTAFWTQCYLDMAQIMVEAGCVPYLQFGEVQWWYFPAHGGMPFYDAYTTQQFAAAYGRSMHVFTNAQENPDTWPQERDHLLGLIGQFTSAVISAVRAAYPTARFEVLYPPDVNNAPLTAAVNLPAQWTLATLACFITENFTYTGQRDLDKAQSSMRTGQTLGFPRNKCAHLVGIGGYATPWEKEARMAEGESPESVVLFALDQYCLIGLGLKQSKGRSGLLGI